MKNLIMILVASLLTSFLVMIAFQRDTVYKNNYTGDLRNRVVGARLIDDGKLPYFYEWKPSDGLRYYDPSSFSSSIVSNRSASPLFHELLIPICNFSQFQLTNIWFYLEYFCFLTIVCIAISLSNTFKLKILAGAAALAFLFTDAWKSHISSGQIYILIPFICSLFVLLFIKAKNSYYYLTCGFLASILVLIRPNFIIFFFPFILLLKQIKVKDVFALLLPMIFFIAWIFVSPFQRALWKEYISFLQKSIYMHQHDGENVMNLNPDLHVKYDIWEGIIWKDVNKKTSSGVIVPHSENGNFFVLYNKIFHTKISTLTLSLLCYSLIIALLLYLYRLTKGNLFIPDHLYPIMIFGFCLYMISDLFSPIYRHQYYTVQWFFVVLFFLGIPKTLQQKKYNILVLAGIFLNMINVNFIKMEHTIGEYLILISLLLYCFNYFKPVSLEE